MRFASFGAVPSWWVVLEDHESARPVAAALRAWPPGSSTTRRPAVAARMLARGTVTVGRPATPRWRWSASTRSRPAQLAAAAGRVRAVADLDRLAASLAGSAHLVASVAGQVRVQGTVTGRPAGLPRQHRRRPRGRGPGRRPRRAAGRRARRAAAGAAPAAPARPLPARRAAGLAGGGGPARPTHYLVLDGNGQAPAVRWWTPPEPVVPMAEGAPALREALSAAVATPHRAATSWSAATWAGWTRPRSAASPPAGRRRWSPPTPPPAADPAGRRRRLGRCGRSPGCRHVEHHVIPAEEMPLSSTSGILDMDDRLTSRARATVDARALAGHRPAGRRPGLAAAPGRLRRRRAALRLARPPASLLRTSPRTALGHLRGFAAKYRWPRRPVLRQLSDTSPYAAWLAGVADTVTAPPPAPTRAAAGLGVRAPAAALGDAGRRPGGAGPDPRRGPRRRAAGRRPRPAAGAGDDALPVPDDPPVRARWPAGSGSARRPLLRRPGGRGRASPCGPQDRITPWRYKPLIVEAMRGIVPDESLARQTKANGSGDVDPGLRRHRAELLALWEDSRLGRLGLIDAAALREPCTGPLPPELQFGVLDQTGRLRGLAALAGTRRPCRAEETRTDDADPARRRVHRRHRLRHDAAGRGQRRVLHAQPHRPPWRCGRCSDGGTAGTGRAGADRAVRGRYRHRRPRRRRPGRRAARGPAGAGAAAP